MQAERYGGIHNFSFDLKTCEVRPMHKPHIPDLEECTCLYCDECFLIESSEEPVCPKCGNKEQEEFDLQPNQDEERAN